MVTIIAAHYGVSTASYSICSERVYPAIVSLGARSWRKASHYDVAKSTIRKGEGDHHCGTLKGLRCQLFDL
jgi:hypothetical protein